MYKLYKKIQINTKTYYPVRPFLKPVNTFLNAGLLTQNLREKRG